MFTPNRESPAATTFQHVGIDEPPLLGKSFPVIKDGDPESGRPQLTPFFNSRQFKLWEEKDLQDFNHLVDCLMKWRDRGWCEFTEQSEWIKEKENWMSWIKWYTVMQVPAAEVTSHMDKAAVHPDINPVR
tara:strand:- start:39 stop:428 length:390 start_codon:yes stop_codon:yes gene_type:complete